MVRVVVRQRWNQQLFGRVVAHELPDALVERLDHALEAAFLEAEECDLRAVHPELCGGLLGLCAPHARQLLGGDDVAGSGRGSFCVEKR